MSSEDEIPLPIIYSVKNYVPSIHTDVIPPNATFEMRILPGLIFVNMFVQALRWPVFGYIILPMAVSHIVTEPNSAHMPLRIWQTVPAVNWNDSFLIGNGRVGAVVPGSAQVDVIHFNEDS